jgi:tetratricopeptide (TPR) repeat protein
VGSVRPGARSVHGEATGQGNWPLQEGHRAQSQLRARSRVSRVAARLPRGRTDEAIKEAETAIRLSPPDPELYHFFYAIGMAHFVAGRYDQAATWGEKAENERPAGIGFGPLRLLASSYAHLDRLDEAREAFASVLEVTPRISATGIRNAIHFGRPDDLERFLEGLRKAGLPE